MKTLTAVIIPLVTITLGCATTMPESQIPAKMFDSLTAAERAAIPSGGDIRVDVYPDAVVYTKSAYTKDHQYEKYRGQNERKNADGSVSVPPIMVGSHDETRSVGSRVHIEIQRSRFCIPETTSCSRMVRSSVYVLLEAPATIRTEGLLVREVIQTFDGGYARMLDLTRSKVDALIVAVKTVEREWTITPGECKVFNSQERLSPDDNLIRRRIATILYDREMKYLTFHAVQAWNEALIRYQFARNGCYRDRPVEEAKIVQAGQRIVDQVLHWKGGR